MPGQPQHDLHILPPEALQTVNEEEGPSPYMMPATVAMPGQLGYEDYNNPTQTGHVSHMMPATVAMPGQLGYEDYNNLTQTGDVSHMIPATVAMPGQTQYVPNSIPPEALPVVNLEEDEAKGRLDLIVRNEPTEAVAYVPEDRADSPTFGNNYYK